MVTRRRRIELAALALATGATFGCSTLPNHKISDTPLANEIAGPNFTDAELEDLAERTSVYAIFALLVYREDLPKPLRSSEACSHLEPSRPMPKQVLPVAPDGSRWMRWTKEPLGRNIPRPCTALTSGLFFEVFVRVSEDDKAANVVLAVRGTDSKSDFWDWMTNIFSFVGLEPPQFADFDYEVLELIDQIVRELQVGREGTRTVQVHTTGHSLGGALAQRIAYMSEHVTEAYAFNTSPFTELGRTRGSGGAQPRDRLRVYRVSHQNDILESVRERYDRLHGVDSAVRDIRFRFASLGKADSHAMALLACNIARLLPEKSGQHQLVTRKSAQDTLFAASEPGAAALCSAYPPSH